MGEHLDVILIDLREFVDFLRIFAVMRPAMETESRRFDAAVMEADPVVGGIPGPEHAFGDEALVKGPALVLAVVVGRVRPREKSQAVGDRPQVRTKRIRGPSDVPAQRAR